MGKSSIYLLIFLVGTIPSFFIAQVAQLPLSPATAEQGEMVDPIFGRQKLEKLKEVTSLHKKFLAQLDQYKRCLITGPCTKQEMDEFRRDFKRLIYVIIFTCIGGYALRWQYKSLKKAEVTPIWWKFPWQWCRLKKRQVKKSVKAVEKGLNNIEKVAILAGEVAEGNGITAETPVGKISISPTKKLESQQPIIEEISQEQQTWGEYLGSYVPWSWLGYSAEDSSEQVPANNT